MTKPLFSANILTLFPDMFPTILSQSLAGKALNRGIWELNVFDICSFSKTLISPIDDRPYGGGGGMLLSAESIGVAVDYILSKNPDTTLVYMSPTGARLEQEMVKKLSNSQSITVLCGHFEGVDQRVLDFFNFFSLSIGDYVLSGGEVASIVLLDACVRLLPEVATNYDSIQNDSFGDDGLLEYPHYTRPHVWRDLQVPDVLLSGNHAKIKDWRHCESVKRTALYRPHLLDKEEGKNL